MKESRAKALGWDRKDPTWKDISDAARTGKLTFGMTNPTASNTGFTATIGLAAALAKNPDALTDADVKNPMISAFFKGQTLTAGSSGWLAEAYAREQGKVDALTIRVFPILFGEAKPAEMQALAELTGGQVFDSKSKTLAAVFKEIRGYQ